jgi:hypothetical protein
MTPEFKPVLIFSETLKESTRNIYTDTPEQNDLFETLQKLIGAVNELKAQGFNVYAGSLIQATQGALTFDFLSNTLKVNHLFILEKDALKQA